MPYRTNKGIGKNRSRRDMFTRMYYLTHVSAGPGNVQIITSW